MAIFVVVLEMLVGPGRAQAARPLGIDVSSYQGGSINWTSVKNSGVTFAWAKATEGTYYYDADFTINEGNAKAAGVYIGAYHFARPDLDVGTAGADTEAAYFWNHAKAYLTGGNGYLVPMLDFETSYGSGASMSAWINEWCQAVKNYAAANGAVCNPVVYTDGSIASSLTSPATNWPLDIADPTCGNPQTTSPGVSLGPWGTWTFWQYCWTASVPGVSGNVDVDVLNGSATTLQAFLITTSVTSAGPGVSLDWDPGAKKASPGSGGTGNWDNGTGNWWLSGTGDVAWNAGGDYADFAGTAGTVTLITGVSADSLTFDTAGYVVTGTSQTLTLNSPGNIDVAPGSPTYIECVLGGVGYNLSGGGILVLNNAGNWSGNSSSAEFIIGPGTTLVVNNQHAVGNGGVTLNLEAGGIYQDNDTTSGDQFLLPGSAIALLSGGGIFDNPNANLTMTNYITGPGSLTIIGTTYTLTLTDTGNNYTGGTIVQSGTLKANAAGVMGSTSGPLTVSGGTLNLNGVSHTVGAVTISGGTIQNGTLTGSSYAGQSGSVSAVLAGSGAMTQTTSGTLTLTGVNTYSGGTTIGGGGVYQVAADSALGAAASPLTLNGGCLKNDSSTVTLNASRSVTLGASGGYIDAGWAPSNPITINGQITGAGPLCINMDGSPVVLANAGNNYSGDTIIGTNGPGYYSAGTAAWLKLGAANVLPNGASAGNVVIFNAYHGRLDLNGYSDTVNGLLGDGVVTNGSSTACTLTIGGNNAGTTFSGTIVSASGNGALALTKTGTGQITLSGANTYTGVTTINGGKLQINADTRLGAAPSSPVANQVTLNNGGIGVGLRVTANTTFSANRGITLVGNGGSVEASSGVTAIYPGVITGVGNFASGGGYTSGYGTNVFSGANNYSGTTTIAAGTLRLAANGTLPYGTPLTIAADNNTGGGGTFDLGGYSQTIGPLASSTGIGGTGADTPTILLTGALTVLQTNSNTTFGGNITGSGGSLTKSGSATLTLSGANTYTGGTTITAGTLEGNVSGSIPGNVNNTGGTLKLDNATAMASSAALTLASTPAAGAVNLNFSGMQTIAALNFGATSKAQGTWGAAGSGAAHQNAAFVGTGLLNVTGGGASQTITFANPGTQTYGAAPIALGATASSGLTVSYSVISGPAAVVGNTLTITGVGAVTVQASQAGDDNYNPAPPVPQTFTVNPLPAQLSGTRSYDGTSTADYSILSVANVISPDTVNVASGSGALVGADVGSQAIASFDSLTLGNNSAGNYTLTGASGSVTITNAGSTNNVAASPNPALPGANVTLTVALGAVPPGAGTPTGTVVFKTNGVALADAIALDGSGVATLITNSFPHGSNTVTAEFTGNANTLGNTNFLGSTNTVVLVVNTAPVTSNTNATTVQNQALALSEASLLSLAYDPDGDLLSITSAGPTSTNGGTVTVADGAVTYQPVNGFVGTDWFSFVVSDSYGASGTGTVLVAVAAGTVLAPIVTGAPSFESGSGSFQASFVGSPNTTYTIQWAPSPIGPWSFLQTATTDANGLLQLVDTQATPDPERCYRVVYP